jgi:hypothetical protein
LKEDVLQAAREEILEYAKPICKTAEETGLPPLRAINHTIPLIDENKVLPWRPSRCPEALRPLWDEKRRVYLKTGRWKVSNCGNTTPMLLIPKVETDNLKLRVVVDLRARNANTKKMASPLPDMEGILRRVAQCKFRSLIDGQDAYEQIRVVPEHVERTAVSTPDGNMVSLVLQQGDCNAPATYQSLMNYLFSDYIGWFMDVYLDDIIIYSDTLNEHIKHVKMVIDVLKEQSLYLSANKMQLLKSELKVLGHIVDDNGIRMDPDKIASVLNWKTPTNRDLLRGYLGSVGYLADDSALIRIPLGILHHLTGDSVPFRWSYTHQRAFEDSKHIASDGKDHHRKPLSYKSDAPPIWLVTDGCSSGIAGVVCQGPDWKNAKVAAFFSAKLNSAQQNYPVHEIEMLAGVEAMLRHRDILQGCHFTWVTDHKGLTHLVNQKNLSGRQARWVEKISGFDFEIKYVPGTENVLADALSRIYSNEAPGTVRSRSEYTYHDVINNNDLEINLITMPVFAGREAIALSSDRVTHSMARAAKEAEAQSGNVSSTAETSRTSRAFGSKTSVYPKEGGGTSKKFASKNADKLAKARQNVTAQSDPRPVDQLSNGDQGPAADHDLVLPPEFIQELENMNESLLQAVNSGWQGLDITKLVAHKYGDDPFFKQILESPKVFRNFEVEDGVLYLKELDRRVLCIPRITYKGRNLREIVISEAHSILAHLGMKKTLDYLRDHVWWKDMVEDTRSYCETCATCKRSKSGNQKPYGLLHSLNPPLQPWESIGVDFVGPVPESKDRDGVYNSIIVIIDLLTGMVHLVPSRNNYTSRQIAELIFEHVYKLHGLPKSIVSDRDVLFTSTFWRRLHELICTKLHMSSAYHPESDGGTERANRTVTQMIRQCIDPKQRDWVARLPAIKFAMNTARSETTGYAPFFLNNGRMPRSLLWNSNNSEYPGVARFALQR